MFHQFLIGVDDDLYGPVRTNMLSRVPLPSLDDAYLAFTQEERSHGIARGKVGKDIIQSQSIFGLRADRLWRFEKEKIKLTCTHYNKGDTKTIHASNSMELRGGTRSCIAIVSRVGMLLHGLSPSPLILLMANKVVVTVHRHGSMLYPPLMAARTMTTLMPSWTSLLSIRRFD